ncbi:MAG TPA: EVE domain-containing protein [Myxococcaceae bacterium]|nr:EVE domain-containing protein [Myxococcaceae bacterium]
MATSHYWLIKSEPNAYPYSQLEREGKTAWTGVRNFEARNNIRSMQPGDLALYYHSGEGKEIVGVARVISSPGPDPTAPREDWAAVDVEPVIALQNPVSLAQVKSTPELSHFPLVTRPRLSVVPVEPAQFRSILKLGRTHLP